jgi:hypothetical protein
MILCGHGGYCTRVPDHGGCHTASPLPGTRDWDLRQQRDITHLDFATPWYADLRDPV